MSPPTKRGRRAVRQRMVAAARERGAQHVVGHERRTRERDRHAGQHAAQVQRDADEKREHVVDLVLARTGKQDDTVLGGVAGRIAVRARRFAERAVDRKVADDADAFRRRAPVQELRLVRLVDRVHARERARVLLAREFVRARRTAEPRVDARRVRQIAAEILHAIDLLRQPVGAPPEREPHVHGRRVRAHAGKQCLYVRGLTPRCEVVRHADDVDLDRGIARAQRGDERADPTGELAGPVRGDRNLHGVSAIEWWRPGPSCFGRADAARGRSARRAARRRSAPAAPRRGTARS